MHNTQGLKIVLIAQMLVTITFCITVEENIDKISLNLKFGCASNSPPTIFPVI